MGCIGNRAFCIYINKPCRQGWFILWQSPLLGIQAIAVVATYVFVFVATLIILKIVDRMVGLRVDEEEESIGLDQSQHR